MNPLLKMAVLSGATRAVELHLGKVVNIDVKDDKGMSLLMYAAMKGHTETCKMLLDAGADPHIENREGKTALCLTEEFEKSETMAVILDFLNRKSFTEIIGIAEPDNSSSDSSNLNSEVVKSGSLVGSVWEEDIEGSPPEDDPSILAEAIKIQRQMTYSTPIDFDEDWTDINIDLPEIIWDNTKKYLQHENWQLEKNLIIRGIMTGRLVTGQIDAITEYIGEQDSDYSERLLMVLTDLGVRIDDMSCDFENPLNIDFLESETEEDHNSIANDAIRFLWEMNDPANDPYWHYLKDARRAPLLSRDEECELGIEIEVGTQELIKAIAYSPFAISSLLDKVDSVTSCLMNINIIAAIKRDSPLDDTEENIFSEDGIEDGIEDEEDESSVTNGSSIKTEFHDEIIERFETIRNLHNKIILSLKQKITKHSARHLLQERIYNELSEMILSAKTLDDLVSCAKHIMLSKQSSEEKIKDICVNQVGMDLIDFQSNYTGNEINLDWCETILSKYDGILGGRLARKSSNIINEQVKLIDLHNKIGLPIEEFSLRYQQLTAGVCRVQSARNKMTVSNLRLVIAIAKKYQNNGLHLDDLIQEGNLGLMKAVERFDYRRGYKFSTYASWWIRQSVTRAISDKSRSIRIPVHMVESLYKLSKEEISFQVLYGRDPSPEELSVRSNIPLQKVIRMLKITRDEPVSLEELIEENSALPDSLKEKIDRSPLEFATRTSLRENVDRVLRTLTPREEKIIRLRFGIAENTDHTLEEVGQCFDVTRERIRQIETKALMKLSHPSRTKVLESFVE